MAISCSLPASMKTVHQVDKNSSKLVIEDGPLPVPCHPDDHLVKVYATALCQGELWWARDYPEIISGDKELVPCSDLAGVVMRAPSTSPLKEGDEVYARVEATRAGCAREFTLVRTGELALKPKSLDWIKTAAVPLSALTAWQGLFVHGMLDAAGLDGKLNENKHAKAKNSEIRVLVTGAGGGVGSWAVQFAKAAGAKTVIAVCSSSKDAIVRTLGATDVIQYDKEFHMTKTTSEFSADLLLDCVGGDALAACWHLAEENAVLLSIADNPKSVKPKDVAKNLAKNEWYLVKPLGSQLAQIAALIDSQNYTVLIDSVYPLHDIQSAFDRVEEKHATGKVVLTVAN